MHREVVNSERAGAGASGLSARVCSAARASPFFCPTWVLFVVSLSSPVLSTSLEPISFLSTTRATLSSTFQLGVLQFLEGNNFFSKSDWSMSIYIYIPDLQKYLLQVRRILARRRIIRQSDVSYNIIRRKNFGIGPALGPFYTEYICLRIICVWQICIICAPNFVLYW